MSPVVRHSGWAVCGILALLARASAQAPVPESGTGGMEEFLRDPSLREPARPGTPAVLPESLLEVPLPTAEPPPQEPLLSRKTPFTLAAGPFVLLLSGQVIVKSDDNIFNSTKNREADLIYTLTPRLMAGSGDYAEQQKTFLSAGFAPSFEIFQKRHDLSDVDYDAFIEGQYAFSKLRIGSRVSFARLTGANEDAPGRVSRDIYSAGLHLEYSVREDISLEVEGKFLHRDYRTQIDADEYLSRNFVTYLVSPTLQAALGAAFGTLQLADDRRQTYEQPLLRLWYQPGARMSFRAIGGMDLRQFDDGQPTRNAPVADLGIVYVASQSESTRLSLDAFRRVQSSSSTPGLNYLSTGLIFRISQRIFHDLYLDLDSGYQRYAYYPVAAGIKVQRRDDYFSVRPKVRYDLNAWGSISLFFHWRDNHSNLANRSYENQQVGIELAVGF